MFHGTKVQQERKFFLWTFCCRERKSRGTKSLSLSHRVSQNHTCNSSQTKQTKFHWNATLRCVIYLVFTNLIGDFWKMSSVAGFHFVHTLRRSLSQILTIHLLFHYMLDMQRSSDTDTRLQCFSHIHALLTGPNPFDTAEHLEPCYPVLV